MLALVIFFPQMNLSCNMKEYLQNKRKNVLNQDILELGSLLLCEHLKTRDRYQSEAVKKYSFPKTKKTKTIIMSFHIFN